MALRLVDHLATSWRDRIAGAVVGLALPNSLAFLIAYHAVMRGGGAPALLNTALPDKSLFRLVSDLKLSLVLSSKPCDGVEAES